MRLFDEVVWEQEIAGGGAVYSLPRYDPLLSVGEQLAVTLVCDLVGGDAAWLRADLDQSNDGRNWVPKTALVGSTLLATSAVVTLMGVDESAMPTASLARIRFTLAGSSPRARVRAMALARQVWVQNAVLWEADFTGLAPGSLTRLPASLKLTRASSATVQSSAATVVASGITTDVARIGDDGTHWGLVLEEARTNLLPDSRAIDAASWLVGLSVTTTANTATGPDGTASIADRSQVASLGYSNYNEQSPAAGSYTLSAWVQRGAAGATGQLVLRTDDGATNRATGGTLASYWQRVSVVAAHAAGVVWSIPVDGRDWSADGGIVAGARDALTDLIQLEAGKFATEVIVTSGATASRAGERLYHPTASELVSEGRLALEFRLQPKAAPADYGAVMRLWTLDASNYCEVSNVTKKVTMVINAVPFEFPAAMAWAAGDRVELWVEGGSVTSAAHYRVNGGDTVSLGNSGSRRDAISSDMPSLDLGALQVIPDPEMRQLAEDALVAILEWQARYRPPDPFEVGVSGVAAFFRALIEGTIEKPGGGAPLLDEELRRTLAQNLAKAGLDVPEFHESLPIPSGPITEKEIADLMDIGLRPPDAIRMDLSTRTVAWRTTPWPTRANDALGQFLATARADDPLAPFAHLWMAENLLREDRPEEGEIAWATWLQRYRDSMFRGAPLWPTAEVGRALCLKKMHQFDRALDCMKDLATGPERIDHRESMALWLANNAEELGRLDLARQTYEYILREYPDDTPGRTRLRQEARDGVARTERGRLGPPWLRRDLQSLIATLAGAFEQRSVRTLERLRPPFTMLLGIGCGEGSSVEAETLVALLLEDLAQSHIKVDRTPIDAGGDKVYCRTSGWNGRWFVADVFLQFRRAPSGAWSWSGLVLTLPTASWRDLSKRLGAVEVRPATNQPLPREFSIKAPWPRASTTNGWAGRMRAGGLLPFVGQVAFTIGLSNLIATFQASGFFGAVVAWVLEVVLAVYELALLDHPCGFALGGFHYNFGFLGAAHIAIPDGFESSFAIDFSIPDPGSQVSLALLRSGVLPREPTALRALLLARGLIPRNIWSTPALACATGIVTVVSPMMPGGPPVRGYGDAAGVELQHGNAIITAPVRGGTRCSWNLPGGPCVVTPDQPAMLRGPFTSRILHFRTGSVRVSPGMVIQQGTQLGIYNNTGVSVFDHIHFELHDRTLTIPTSTPGGPGALDARIGQSLRPDPMDGQSPSSDGACIRSTNIAIPAF